MAEAAHKAHLALAAQRIIRLLNGGKRRRRSVRPSGRYHTNVTVTPLARAIHECALVRPRRAAPLGQNPDYVPAVEQIGEGVFIQFQ